MIFGRPTQPLAVRTRVSIGPRDPERLPRAPHALGPALMRRVEELTEGGRLPRPAMLGIGPDHVEEFDLLPLLRERRDLHHFAAAVAGQQGLEVVALLGTFSLRFGGRPAQRGILCFLEWPDGAWWCAARPVEPRVAPLVRAAVDGHPRPGGLGGWWSRARREGLRLHMGSQDGLVH